MNHLGGKKEVIKKKRTKKTQNKQVETVVNRCKILNIYQKELVCQVQDSF